MLHRNSIQAIKVGHSEIILLNLYATIHGKTSGFKAYSSRIFGLAMDKVSISQVEHDCSASVHADLSLCFHLFLSESAFSKI